MDKVLYQALKDIISTNLSVRHLSVDEINRRYRAIETIKEAVKPYDEIAKVILDRMGDYQYQRDSIFWFYIVTLNRVDPSEHQLDFDIVFDYLLETGKIKPVQWINDPTVTGYEVVK